MADIPIISKDIRRVYGGSGPDSTVIIQAVTTGRRQGNIISPLEGRNNFRIELKRPITEEEYNRLESSGIRFLEKIEEGDRKAFYSIVGVIEDNEISATDATPENVERDLPNLKTEAIDAINEEITNRGEKVSPTVPSNVASTNTQTQEVSSTPVATGLGQGGTKPKTVLVYPIDMSDQQDCMEFSIFTYENRKLGAETVTLNQFESTGGGNIYEKGFISVKDQPTVFLPVTKISDTNSVNWQEDQLNEFQRYAASVGLKAMGGNLENFGESVSNFLQSTLSGISNFTNFAKSSDAFGNYVRTMLAGQAVQANNLVTRATGSVINPNMELLFNGPLLRQFQFSFDLIAKSRNEADEIKKIIRFFKQNMAVRESGVKIPYTEIEQEIGEGKKITAGLGGNNLFLSSPYLFRLRYLTSAVNRARQVHQSIGQIKMCALQNFTVDYTPMSTYMTFTDGTMFMYRLSMAFKELTPLYDTDYASTHPIGF